MDDREWAAKWVGLFYGDDGTVGDEVDEFGAILGFSYSDPEIAEAVRRKFLSNEYENASSMGKCDMAYIPIVWFSHGPLAFIKTIRATLDPP